MLKRIAFTFMFLILLLNLIVLSYIIFEPKSKTTNTIVSNYLSYKNLDSYTLDTGNNTNHYYYFCIPQENNCEYVYNSIYLKVVSEKPAIKNLIEYVDLSSIKDSANFYEELKKWEINNYPAFISTTNIDNKIVINNQLVFDEKKPINEADFLNWLELNSLISGISN